MKTREEVEKLKQDWLKDGCWDIETTEGYEDYKDELLKFRLSIENQYKEKQNKHREELASKYCPMNMNAMPGYQGCKLEKCAWWHSQRECCSMLFLAHLEDIADASRVYQQIHN